MALRDGMNTRDRRDTRGESMMEMKDWTTTGKDEGKGG